MFDHGQPSYAEVNKDVLSVMLETGPRYWMALGATISIAGICFFMPWFYQLTVGVGAAGMNRNAVWGTYLSNFIFWIGLSHSGTLLSAVLHITNSHWRKSIYRSAEAMTLFSLMTAALFVMVHVGRVWFVHWSFPVPNEQGLWPNFRSPLMFDVMAITTYLTASSIFIYMGSVPDFAAVRDASSGLRRRLNTIFSFGRDHGDFGRLLNQTVVSVPTLVVRDGHEITGFCFTPQDGNSLLSSIAATAWLLDPIMYERRIQFMTPYLFDDV